ncbi:MAG: ATP-binding protein [Cytophagales bacterium]
MAYPIREKLLEIPIMQQESKEVIDWLLAHSEYRNVKEGDYFFKKGDLVEEMIIILEGEMSFMIEAGGNFLKTGSAKSGDITGVLPFSRMKEAGGTSQVVIDTHCLAVHKKHFSEMERVSQSLVQNLVGLMSDRVRSFTMLQQQREKMEALGKMSAGIAHEINNPASAIRSTSRELDKKWKKLQDLSFNLMSSGLEMNAIENIKKVLDLDSETRPKQISMIDKSNLEDEMIDYLDELGFEDGMELAEDLIDQGIYKEQVEEIAKQIGEKGLEIFLNWLVLNSSVHEMLKDVNEASERISKLVASIKSHSHMDRAPELAEVDINDGIESTLVIFQHKIKEKNINLILDFENDLPKIQGMEGELNQVWTNIIDNALDAMDSEGQLKISAASNKNFLKVKIEDNGPGIPENIVNQIFEPFFTTKDLGKGTGLGLDISSRIIKEHNGNINVKSKPGQTIFEISLPVNQ